MLGWLKKSAHQDLKVDIHSHLIPGIDDGVKKLENSIDIIRRLKSLGYQKAVTTPHIHPSFPNTPDKIKGGLAQVQEEIERENLSFSLEAAAEYFVDDSFMSTVENGREILSFGDKYVLVESSFLNKPMFFEACLFELMSKGYKPILAHPERYKFLEGKIDWLLELKQMGVLFQVTVSSFVGYYGTTPRKIAKELFRKDMIDFLGSDLHRLDQVDYLEKGLKEKEVDKLCKSSFLRNEQLL